MAAIHSIPTIAERIAQHPCYSEQAHQYARIHLPVAPACNIQCNYCNRKFDCSNESRPGVVSKLLSPADAVKRFVAIKERMPNLKVVGIAGPGDALANPNKTFATLKAIQEVSDDVQLCISTNGLQLEDYVDDLVDAGVHHLTITLNTLEPTIAQYLYAWIYYQGKRITGLEAAQTLIERQVAGLRAASEAGLLLKVNTVLVPGVTDQSIDKLAQFLKSENVFLHNIMPLISDPAHGTAFGLHGIRGPNDDELLEARIQAGVDMKQMTHCQQCRADAVGTLAPSPCAETAASTIKVAVASKDGKVIDQHFGHAQQFWIFEVSTSRVRFIECRSVEQYCQDKEECDTSDDLPAAIATIQDCAQVLSVRMGMAPWQQAEAIGLQPVTDYAYQPLTESLKKIQALLPVTPSLAEVS